MLNRQVSWEAFVPKKKMMIVWAALIGSLNLAPGALGQDKVQVEITAPLGGLVDPVHRVRGRVSDAGAEVWVIVHPTLIRSCFANPTIVSGTGDWSGTVVFGNESTPSGTPFEFIAIANPTEIISEGQVICWPRSESATQPVDVKLR